MRTIINDLENKSQDPILNLIIQNEFCQLDLFHSLERML